MGSVEVVCACGQRCSYTRPAYARSVRLGRVLACEDCRRGRTLLPPLPDCPAMLLVAIAAGNSRGAAPSVDDLALFLGVGREHAQRDLSRLEEEGLVARGIYPGRGYKAIKRGWDLVLDRG